MRVIISPLAQQQIKDASKWHNKQQKGLGARFTKSIRDTINILKVNPFYQIRYSNVRILNTKTFSYLIHYVVKDKEKMIIIFGVFHASRNIDHYIKK
ncbi:MAG: type II toxin-antitoxin system RelE/ParE family toxin [Bacteroidetes bacterium]|nr:type II toxin-antitoxin system RelE/ParE family toxin [Bacteroidota bacterium]MCB9227392.1 type II toxin-antitoxin system RelE/ParE family toxin [Chitinophagales bacterium]